MDGTLRAYQHTHARHAGAGDAGVAEHRRRQRKVARNKTPARREFLGPDVLFRYTYSRTREHIFPWADRVDGRFQRASSGGQPSCAQRKEQGRRGSSAAWRPRRAQRREPRARQRRRWPNRPLAPACQRGSCRAQAASSDPTRPCRPAPLPAPPAASWSPPAASCPPPTAQGQPPPPPTETMGWGGGWRRGDGARTHEEDGWVGWWLTTRRVRRTPCPGSPRAPCA